MSERARARVFLFISMAHGRELARPRRLTLPGQGPAYEGGRGGTDSRLAGCPAGEEEAEHER